MPVRKKAGESKDEFIQRCMSIEEQAFPDENQRYAICISYYEDTMKKQTTEQKIYNRIQNCKRQREENLITPNPCGQEGYVAYGTKIKNGREVPNCIKVD
jgi:predicted Zn-ribbon and HTH transcriptional regulator